MQLTPYTQPRSLNQPAPSHVNTHVIPHTSLEPNWRSQAPHTPASVIYVIESPHTASALPPNTAHPPNSAYSSKAAKIAKTAEKNKSFLAQLAPELRSYVVGVSISAWDRDLTPWPLNTPMLGRGDFAGQAPTTLAKLKELADDFESNTLGLASAGDTPQSAPRRAVAGYSLGGLFAAWALVREPEFFSAAASVSGSLWYENWCEWAQAELGSPRALAQHGFYASFGSKEPHAKNPVLKTVGNCTARTLATFENAGATCTFVQEQGGHFFEQEARLARGICWLDSYLASGAFLSARPAPLLGTARLL